MKTNKLTEIQEKKFDKEVKKLTKRFEMGEILGFEFDRKFRKLSDKYLK